MNVVILDVCFKVRNKLAAYMWICIWNLTLNRYVQHFIITKKKLF